jgi:hypothetical protein
MLNAALWNSKLEPMSSDHIKQGMLKNADEIKRLKSRIDQTMPHRSESREKRREWESACSDFHKRYNALAFPGGYNGALERIVAGDAEAMEAGFCFLECRPYFFRSGYIFKEILRKAKRAPLSPDQTRRLQVVVQRLAEWRSRSRRV